MPEALLNGLALLGWNPPSREDPNVLSQDMAAVLKSEVLRMSEMEGLFSIGKVGKSGVKFDEGKLEFLNSMHIRDKFTYYQDLEERQECVQEFREIVMKVLDQSLHKRIRQTSDKNMLKIMDMMKQRIHFYSDLENHTYFFVEPLYNTERSQKFEKRLRQPTEVKIEILEDLLVLFEQLKAELGTNPVDKDRINKICSLYLFENKDRKLKNEDVFFLLRFAITGNPVGAPTGDICEVIGLPEVIDRCKNTLDHFKKDV